MQDELTEHFYSSILKANPGIMYVFNLEKNTNEYISQSSTSLVGYTPEELNAMGGELLVKLIYPEDLRKIGKHFESIQNNPLDEIQTLEFRIIPKGSTPVSENVVWMISYDKPLERNSKFEVVKVSGIVLDITELKNVQAQLNNRNNLLSNIATMNHVHTAVVDIRTGMIEYSNNGLEEALGFETTDDDGNPISVYEVFSKIMPEEDQLKVKAQVQNFLPSAPKKSQQIELRHFDDKGKIRWFNWHSMPYELTESGEIKTIINFALEITETKIAHTKLEAIQTELEEYTEKSSNNLLEPLIAIQASLQLLKNELKGIDNPIIERCVDMMMGTSVSMKQNVIAILDYSKLNVDKNFSLVDLNVVLNNVSSSLNSAIKKANAIIGIDTKLPSIHGDFTLIGLMFQNLISNAIKFQNEGQQPIIQIKYEQSSTHHVIHVKDNGIGISEESQERIFNLFQRLHKRDQFEGNGIGLAHALKIMSLHGGKIEVESSIGEGSTFSCYFLRGM